MPLRVYTAAERPFDSVAHVGIVITLIRHAPGQQHVGILHRDESTNELAVLHLAWHLDLKNGPPKPTYAWIAPPIPNKRARQVAAFCRKVWRANPGGIPYALSSASDCFNQETGAFLAGDSRYGLTCASFVLGVFHSVGISLIKYETWPKSRVGDEAWRLHIVEMLKGCGASADHIRNFESQVDAIRYRPEDVAGAGAAESVPAAFEEVEPLAQEILEKLRHNNLYT